MFGQAANDMEVGSSSLRMGAGISSAQAFSSTEYARPQELHLTSPLPSGNRMPQ
jgi:hypothetical protein